MQRRWFYGAKDKSKDFMWEVYPDWVYIDPQSDMIVILGMGVSEEGQEQLEVEFDGDCEGQGAVFHIIDQITYEQWKEVSEALKEHYGKY